MCNWEQPGGKWLGIVDVCRRSTVWVRFGRSGEYPQLPMPVYWAARVAAYGFGEEIGWRGFLLPRLRARVTALWSTLFSYGTQKIQHAH
jgi:Type II CAAX prenyl endopeptidase Rce1-like